jgi:carbamoyltransferase
MRILGISPLDKDSTAALVDGGKVIYAIGEERLSRTKMQSGFPHLALEEILRRTGMKAKDLDKVVYPFFDAATEARLMREAFDTFEKERESHNEDELFEKFRNLPVWKRRKFNIPGVEESVLYMNKGWLKETAYRLAATQPGIARMLHKKYFREWLETASADHQKWNDDLDQGLKKFGLSDKLVRVDHHLSHAANAYYTSGFEDALIVTLDGYGSGLAGSVSVGKAGQIKMIHKLPYPASLGEFYERVTSSVGLKPSRHEGKVVGLAAYESPEVIGDVVRAFFEFKDGAIRYRLPHNHFFSRHLASAYPKPVVASAYQKVLEEIGSQYIAYWQKQTGISNLCLSGGVVANVKANQRFFEVPGIENVFVHPNMGDGGCGVGGALLWEARNGLMPYRLDDVYFGPEYTKEEIREELRKENLLPEEPADLEKAVAQLLADGHIVARFDGRMEYGPRALGNRTIMYHAKDPSVNLWLNQQLNRTEYMPFAPVCMHERRHKCYKNMDGADYAAEFMTVTFDCTPWFIENCPAAAHVDGTARPQLVRKEVNPKYHRILEEYEKLTGIPSVINTSFNMHEEPIVCTPYDAIRAFKLGHIPYLAIGPFLVKGETTPGK